MVRVGDPLFLSFASNHIFRIRQARHFKCRLLIDTTEKSTSACVIDKPRKRYGRGHVTSLYFRKLVIIY